ncbi:unnamed protein product, partial [Effrenium voratum]
RAEALKKFRRLGTKPLPALLPDNGDPEDVHIFVIGDWGTYPGTGINMASDWTEQMWNTHCFRGARSPQHWKEAKANGYTTAAKVTRSWGGGRPICGSMHLECSWDKGGASKNNRCNPDHDAFWRDHYAQQNVATSMTDLARERKPSFIINTADNFYYAGVESTTDPLWSMMFEELYPDQSLQIPWLGSLGNHDYGGHTCDVCLWPKIGHRDNRRDSPCSQAMIDYDTEHDWQWPNNKKVRWVLPMKGENRWYMKSFDFKKGNVTIDVFVIDTNKAHVSSQCHSSCPDSVAPKCVSFFMQLWTRQRAWLLPALEQSTANWKMVVGHAPPENFEESLMEEMRDRGVSVFMAGHVHQLRHDRHPSGIEVIVSGSGGGYQSAGGGTSYTLHETQDYGFATIHAQWDKLTVEYVNDQGRVLWDPIVIPKVDLVQEGLLKKLREAAIKSDVPATKDAIGKAKAHGVDDSYIYAAAMAGVKAFEATGGMTWVHMEPKLMKAGAATTSAILASWTTEESLPTEVTKLAVPARCCTPMTVPHSQTVLCDSTKELCSSQQMAKNARGAGAAAMLWVSKEQAQADSQDAEAFDIPVASIPKSFVLDVPSWLGNQDEEIFITFTGGEKGYEKSLDAARTAGVPETIIEAAILAAKQRRAEEHVQAAMATTDQQVIKAALAMAEEFGAESDLIEQVQPQPEPAGLKRAVARRKLAILILQDSLASADQNCKDFNAVHDMIQQAKALEVGPTDKAEGCRKDLAVTALNAALELGSACKDPLSVAVSWCKLAGGLDSRIEDAEKKCDKEVAAASRRTLLIVLVLLVLLGAGAGVVLYSKRRPQAPPQPSPGGIELLEAESAS